jgi:solute carrier family 25 (mitochondrial phosphate transporter), member 23/24/25/41
VVKIMPESAIKFGSFEAAKRAVAQLEGHNDPTKIANTSKFICGGIGGLCSQFAVYPVDTLKFRMQCEIVEGGLRGNALIIETAKKLWKTGGFYRGLPLGLIGIFPYSALDLGTFETLKRKIATYNAKRRGCHEDDAMPGSIVTAAIGGFSGAFGASVVYPLNLLRTRLQAQGTVLHPPTYTGVWDVTTKTVKNEGFRGLFRGITPNLIKVVPAVSIVSETLYINNTRTDCLQTYVVYEKSKQSLSLA